MYGVNTGTYNTTLPLIIQINQGAATSATIANVNWSTYFGGTLADLIYKSKSDAGNNLFVAGKTISSFFPQGVGATPFQSQLNGGFDGFLAKFKPSGELDWSTYIGAEGSEQINDFDFKGNQVYCIGSTTSFSLPALAKTGASNDNSFAGGGSDGFIFQTNIPFGNTNNWLRYYGESHTDELRACKFDAGGDFFIVGASTSTNIPVIASAGQYSQTYNPAQIWAPGPTFENTVYDGIILKFAAPSSSLTWATYYGTYSVTGIGSQYSHDEFNALDIISSTVYVGGYSTGNGLPNSLNSKGTVNWSDGILVNFSTGGVFQAARYTSNMVNNSVKVNNNKLYACGQANGGATVNSGNYYFNGTSSGGLDANFSVHSLNLTTLVHNTFLGGSLDDEARDLQFAPNSVFYVAGITGSFDFPVLAVTGASQLFIRGMMITF